ncbi:hypothetical protein jhhlp_001462 [Lomentospora prolificans]|uniref:RNA polymerase II assembly factor Rtp1 C-terminal domain-containing protein n=1 Tax=Lomentospora prolificans TaxID=41688 RepID=A0A2N3NIB0_9PEZI|nr:hypothetical protein jhhlp_001462 [Lomentospora prolificans]
MVAFDPSSTHSVEAIREARQKFDSILESAGSWSLVQVLNGLVKPGVVAEWLRKEFVAALIRVPMRPQGVRATLEFIFSVHPSSTGITREEEAMPQKRGANITPEALAMAAKLLSSTPPGMLDQDWIQAISPQLFTLLDGTEGPELARVSAHVIAFGILGRKRLGAPGAPGWCTFVNPILQNIKPSINPKWRTEMCENKEGEVIDLSVDKVIVTPDDLHLALHRLSLLLQASPSPGLCRRIVDPIFLQLWILSSWTNPSQRTRERYCDVAMPILKMYLKVTSSSEKTDILLGDLISVGDDENGNIVWKYQKASGGDLQVVIPRTPEQPPHLQDLEAQVVEQKASTLASTLTESCTDTEISAVFMHLFNQWLLSKSTAFSTTIKIKVEDEKQEDLVQGLIKMAVLRYLLEKAEKKVISKLDQLLELVCNVLEANGRESQEKEVLSVTLSLLNQIISAPQFQKDQIKSEVLNLIERSLEEISNDRSSEIGRTAMNLLLLLKYRDELEEPSDATPPTQRQIEDRNTYKLAMSYIRDPESPPPVKSEGLNLISSLIKSNSPALDIQAVLVLLSRLLSDSEDFINLRIVRMFVQLAERHPRTVCQEILDHYLDPKELSSTDTRLRFGEALVQVIERLGLMFTGEAATQAYETLLSIASRRGHRAKTALKQEREARLQERKNKEAADAWGGEVLDMSEELPEEERINNEILSRIVEGWESKRGSEDVRMRTSALSTLSTAVENNITSVGPSLISATVDLCLHVLAFEPEIEKGILRRAAIIFIMGFARALNNAREQGRRLGFGLTEESRDDIMRTLKYIEVTDNDGLVQQHAKDVIESLDNLRLATLLHQETRQAPEIERVVGLPPKLDVRGGGGLRPKIEEIE